MGADTELDFIRDHLRDPRRMIRSGVPDQDFDGSGVPAVAGVVELGAIRDQANDVHAGDHLDVFAGGGHAVFKLQPAGRHHRDVHEEVNVRGDVALVEVEGGAGPSHQAEEKTLAAGVHVARAVSVTNGVGFA